MLVNFFTSTILSALMTGIVVWPSSSDLSGMGNAQYHSVFADWSQPSESDAARACGGCQLGDTGSLCANCVVTISWGGGSTPGVCQQTNPCGPFEDPCYTGAYIVNVTATAPGCKIAWWNETDSGWDGDFKVTSGTVSHDYGDSDDPRVLGAVAFLVV